MSDRTPKNRTAKSSADLVSALRRARVRPAACSLLQRDKTSRQSKRMHTVLDLDLDFFVWPVEHDREENEGRLDPREFSAQSEEQVRRFLEERCGLSPSNRIPGRRLVHHVEAFTTWREWLQKRMLTEPFAVIHVDAHSDLGSGAFNKSPKFFETELLASPLGHSACWYTAHACRNSNAKGCNHERTFSAAIRR